MRTEVAVYKVKEVLHFEDGGQGEYSITESNNSKVDDAKTYLGRIHLIWDWAADAFKVLWGFFEVTRECLPSPRKNHELVEAIVDFRGGLVNRAADDKSLILGYSHNILGSCSIKS